MDTSVRVHDAQKRAFSKAHITKNFIACKLDTKQGFVKVVVQMPLTICDLAHIAIDVYLKLGCNRINYCIENKVSYNLFVQPYNSTMIAAANKAGSNNKTIKIDEIASQISLSVGEVNQMIEDAKIPLIMQNGDLVLVRQSAEALVHNFFSQKKDSVLSGLFHDSEGVAYAIEEIKEEPIADNEPAPNTENKDFDTNMQLPENFDIAAGRKRRPEVKVGLKIAIEALPGGKTAQGFNRYIVKLMNKTDTAAKDFLNAITGQYPTKKNQNVIAELRKAAIEYWNDSGA